MTSPFADAQSADTVACLPAKRKASTFYFTASQSASAPGIAHNPASAKAWNPPLYIDQSAGTIAQYESESSWHTQHCATASKPVQQHRKAWQIQLRHHCHTSHNGTSACLLNLLAGSAQYASLHRFLHEYQSDICRHARKACYQTGQNPRTHLAQSHIRHACSMYNCMASCLKLAQAHVSSLQAQCHRMWICPHNLKGLHKAGDISDTFGKQLYNVSLLANTKGLNIPLAHWPCVKHASAQRCMVGSQCEGLEHPPIEKS